MQFHRDKQRRDGLQNTSSYLDCSTCLAKDAGRRAWHCGEIQRDQWVGNGFARPSGWPGNDGVDVCPGYLIAKPQVAEAARAHLWWTKGNLTQRFPKPTELLMDAIELISSSAAAAEGYSIEQASKPKGGS